MCFAQGSQRSDADEAGTRSPSVSSQALYHWVTALPGIDCIVKQHHTQTYQYPSLAMQVKKIKCYTGKSMLQAELIGHPSV